ncbi:MAG: hypothetical protein K2K97_04170 [Muribaculaceae bacterium]|nr:hypothetical protein [Muribaculaceae bacterium]
MEETATGHSHAIPIPDLSTLQNKEKNPTFTATIRSIIPKIRSTLSSRCCPRAQPEELLLANCSIASM